VEITINFNTEEACSEIIDLLRNNSTDCTFDKKYITITSNIKQHVERLEIINKIDVKTIEKIEVIEMDLMRDFIKNLLIFHNKITMKDIEAEENS
jgi:hypothetical protein